MVTGKYQIGDRRPLASRQARWAQLAAAWLARIGVSPNSISTAGMVFGRVAGGLLALEEAVRRLQVTRSSNDLDGV